MRRIVAVLCGMLVVLLVTVLARGGEPDRPAASVRQAPMPTPTPTPTPQASIERAGIAEHLRALRDAAAAEGTRAAGTRGDRATSRYIASRLRAAGYRVTEPEFTVPLFRERSPARVSGLRRSRFLTLTFSGSGRAAGRARRVGLGCAASDYRGLGRGDVAVADRGVCTFSARARIAQRAGAGALLIISDRGAPFSGSLGTPGVRIPVLAIAEGAAGVLRGHVGVRVDAVSARRATHNVVAETGPEDAKRVVMAGAHLDSVVPGPGMNDNGSGVAAVLEVAEQLAGRPLAGGAALRVGFWGAEEIGLVGSRRYVRSLGAAERRRVRAYVNLDMVGSPGSKAAVYAGTGAAGRRIEAALRDGLPAGAPEEALDSSSDHASFAARGIPVGGIFTGLDRCYHRACDRIGNVDAELAARVARATAAALQRLAR